MTSTLKQLRDEALTYLVLWAASKEYSPDIEAALKHWAATFEIPETELMDRIMAASTGKLTRPDPNATEAEESQPAATATPAADTAAPPSAGNEPAEAEQQQQQQQEQQQEEQQQQNQQEEAMQEDQ